ncbi:hypothetical protein [Myroides indicus]|uniref:Uncharacterized protein n=1 Tax=Myroides indicus TaxID=1323422 RepID=A0A4R7F572_9FLAO|nr:hypothetical protein [Myroides indicus]TDS59633.1 hypothetical protein C8P70_11081 [Myroides indicus]
MNEFYNKLYEIAFFELKQFNKEILAENTPIITKEITLKNGLVICISKWLAIDAFVKFTHKNDTNSYSFDELLAMNYVPEQHQNLEFLEVHSSSFTKLTEV